VSDIDTGGHTRVGLVHIAYIEEGETAMSLLTANRFIVSQKPKLVELTNQYSIMDPQGSVLGRVEQHGQSQVRKVMRFATDLDQFLRHRLTVVDSSGAKVLSIARPAKVFKSRFEVEDGMGRPVGRIVQRNVFGKIGFEMTDATGAVVGAIKAENWRAWDFSIVDQHDREVGRIDKKFVGILNATFTPADNYIVDLAEDLDGDRRALALAAALAVDTALKQDARGFSLTSLFS
jgi:uncharacterized protein YxjI